jgi:hypothetical protein
MYRLPSEVLELEIGRGRSNCLKGRISRTRRPSLGSQELAAAGST